MKRVIAFMLLAIAVILVGCGKAAPSDESEETKEEVKTMAEQFTEIGFTDEEVKKMQEIFTTVGITEISNIKAAVGDGIDKLQSFKCDMYDSTSDKGGVVVQFTIDKRQLCYISVNGFYNTITMQYDSAVLYDILDENGEIIPDTVGYKAVLDNENKKITPYE